MSLRFSPVAKSERVLSPSYWFCDEKLGDGFLGSPGSTDQRENIRLEHWDTDRARWSLGYYPFFIVLSSQLAIFSLPISSFLLFFSSFCFLPDFLSLLINFLPFTRVSAFGKHFLTLFRAIQYSRSLILNI